VKNIWINKVSPHDQHHYYYLQKGNKELRWMGKTNIICYRTVKKTGKHLLIFECECIYMNMYNVEIVNPL